MEAGPAAAAPAPETAVPVAATEDVKLTEAAAPAKAAVEPSVTRFIQTSALALAIAAVSGRWQGGGVGVFFTALARGAGAIPAAAVQYDSPSRLPWVTPCVDFVFLQDALFVWEGSVGRFCLVQGDGAW